MASVKRYYDCEKCHYSYFDDYDRLRCIRPECCDGGKYDDEECDENERDSKM